MAEFKREQILAALAAALGNVPRNIPLAELDTGQMHRSLHDGTPELVDEFINPPTYEWTIRPAIFLAIEWSGPNSPDAALAEMIDEVAQAIAGITDGLGGLVTDIRPQAPDFAPRALWGAANIKGAEVVIEIDYWSSSSLG